MVSLGRKSEDKETVIAVEHSTLLYSTTKAFFTANRLLIARYLTSTCYLLSMFEKEIISLRVALVNKFYHICSYLCSFNIQGCLRSGDNRNLPWWRICDSREINFALELRRWPQNGQRVRRLLACPRRLIPFFVPYWCNLIPRRVDRDVVFVLTSGFLSLKSPMRIILQLPFLPLFTSFYIFLFLLFFPLLILYVG